MAPKDPWADVYQKVPLFMGGYIQVVQGYDITNGLFYIAGAQTQTLISTIVPQGQVLLITDFANQLNDIAAWGYFTWVLKVNGNPVSSYDNITQQLGTNNQMRKVGVDILISAGQTFIVECSSAATTPAIYEALASLKGVYGYQQWEAI